MITKDYFLYWNKIKEEKEKKEEEGRLFTSLSCLLATLFALS